MTPNPILKVLSTFRKSKVRCLLIGGQACIIYGAAEFSRDSDFVILSDPENLNRLRAALKALKAEPIYVPPLDESYLKKGHACHFRCMAKDVLGLRIDIISILRGCDSFSELWKKKRTVELKNGLAIDVLGIEDLVQSKKTQRDKDWLMLKRLVDNDISIYKNSPPGNRVKWWLRECRDSKLLIELAKRFPKLAAEYVKDRPLLSSAIANDIEKLKSELRDEETAERQKDIDYWVPLRRELEALRHKTAVKPPT